MAQDSDADMMKKIADTMAPETEYIAKVKDKDGNDVDVKFRIIHWAPTRVYKMIPTIGKIVGVPAAMLIGGGESFQEALAGALLQMFQTFEEQDIMAFIKDMLSNVYCNGTCVADNLDQTFMKHPQLILQLVVKVLEVTYSPFMQIDLGQSMKTLSQVAGMQKATSPQL